MSVNVSTPQRTYNSNLMAQYQAQMAAQPLAAQPLAAPLAVPLAGQPMVGTDTNTRVKNYLARKQAEARNTLGGIQFNPTPAVQPTPMPPGVTVSTTGDPTSPSIYSTGSFNWNTDRIIKKALKYLLEGLAVAIAAHFFGRNRLNLKEIIMIGITAAFVFAILDIFSPEVSFGARTGAGFAIGYNALGFGAPSLIPVAL